MKTNELIAMLKTARQLGHSDLRIVIDDSRDGVESLVTAAAELRTRPTNTTPEEVLLVIRYA